MSGLGGIHPHQPLVDRGKGYGNGHYRSAGYRILVKSISRKGFPLAVVGQVPPLVKVSDRIVLPATGEMPGRTLSGWADRTAGGEREPAPESGVGVAAERPG